MIIYPPLIADQIPAFTSSGISVPFTWNPAVPKDDNILISLQVKDYFSSKVAYKSEEGVKATLGVAYFNTPAVLKVGRYYKIQIAYTDGDGSELTYSSAVLGKYIEKPVSIAITDINDIVLEEKGANPIVYCGRYTRTQLNEPLYSYCFTLRDPLGKVVETSGEVVWDNEKDIEVTAGTYVSKPSFALKTELNENEIYTMTFEVRTINNYSQTATVAVTRGSAPGAGCELVLTASANEEDGYIELGFKKEPVSNYQNKTFYLERSIKDSNVWEILTTLASGTSKNLLEWSWKDFSAEISTPYTYRIRRFRGGEISTTVSSVDITLQGEHIYLSDGDRCLKVKYNPKVTSFKTTVLEQKTDTIGGKYPFFFRNDAVSYKELPISGLISYHMDENNYFWNKKTAETATRQATPAEDKTGVLDETELERIFKLEVLNWLNNGKPKLFRSAQEGNYIVRLMNVTLSPNDTTGRMIHSFSCTGYECADCIFEKMQELDLIKIDEVIPTETSYEPASAASPEGVVNDITVPYVKNVTWYCEIPYVNADYPAITLITKEGQTIELAANTGKILETPKDTVYKQMVIHKGIPNSAFYWMYDTDVYNEENDTDDFVYNGTTAVTEDGVWLSGKDVETDVEYKNVRYLSLEKNTSSEESSVTMSIDPGLIRLDDNQIRTYAPNKDVTFTNIANVFITLLCQEVIANDSQNNITE